MSTAAGSADRCPVLRWNGVRDVRGDRCQVGKQKVGFLKKCSGIISSGGPCVPHTVALCFSSHLIIKDIEVCALSFDRARDLSVLELDNCDTPDLRILINITLLAVSKTTPSVSQPSYRSFRSSVSQCTFTILVTCRPLMILLCITSYETAY